MADIFKDLSNIAKMSIGPAYGVYNIFADVKTGKSMLGTLLWQKLSQQGYKIIILDCEKGRDGYSAYHQDPYNLPKEVILNIKSWADMVMFMKYVAKAPKDQFEKTLLYVDPFSQVANMRMADLAEKAGTDDMMTKIKSFGQKSETEKSVLNEYKSTIEKTISGFRNAFEFVVLTSHFNYDKIGTAESNVVRQQLDYIGTARSLVTQKSDANIMLSKDEFSQYYVNKIPLSKKAILSVEFGSTHNPKLADVNTVFELADHIVEIMKENTANYYNDYYKQFKAKGV